MLFLAQSHDHLVLRTDGLACRTSLPAVAAWRAVAALHQIGNSSLKVLQRGHFEADFEPARVQGREGYFRHTLFLDPLGFAGSASGWRGCRWWGGRRRGCARDPIADLGAGALLL